MRLVAPFTVMLLLGWGCGDDATADAGVDASSDVGSTDTSVDGTADVALDSMPPVECAAPPAPMIAGTAETDALADSPARCGQESYVWMRDADRGALVASTALTPYPVALAVGVLESFGVVVEPPPHRVATTTITYRTQERGRDVLATALVASPTTLEPGAEADVVLFLHGTTGFSDRCGASHSTEYQALSAFYAAHGYVVVLPDYIGLAADVGVSTGFVHPFHVGEPTAHAALDAVRAALRLTPEDRSGVCARPRVVAFGVSQGGHAALWVDRLAGYYARELDLLGTIAVVPPAGLVPQIERGIVDPVPLTPLSVAMISAHADWYGAVDQLDELYRAPWDTDIPTLIREGGCDVDTSVLPMDLDELYLPEARAAASAGTLAGFGTFGCTLSHADLVLTEVTPVAQRPVLVLTGEMDDTVNTPLERTAFEALCGTAFEGQYLECAGAGHVEPILWAIPEIRSFLEARFAGEAFVGSCTTAGPQRCMGTPEEM